MAMAQMTLDRPQIQSPRKRWSPIDNCENIDATFSILESHNPQAPGSPSGAKRQRLEREPAGSGLDSPFRVITPDIMGPESSEYSQTEGSLLEGTVSRLRIPDTTYDDHLAWLKTDSLVDQHVPRLITPDATYDHRLAWPSTDSPVVSGHVPELTTPDSTYDDSLAWSQTDSPGVDRRVSRLVTPDSTYDDSMTWSQTDSPLGDQRSLKQRYKKDELWSAIKSDYHYLMDEEIIETCKSTESDLSWDDDDITNLPTRFSFAEFMQQYQEVSDWLAQTRLVLHRRVTNNSERYLNQIYHEDMLASSPRRKLFNDYGKQLTLRYPSLKEEINWRLFVINDRWTTLQNSVVRPSVAIDSNQLIEDVDHDLSTLVRWLQQVEDYLSQLHIQSTWTIDTLHMNIKQHQALQTDIESHSKQIISVLKLCEKLQSGDVQIAASSFSSLQERAVHVERRWHSIWLQSLEWQCRLEHATKDRQGLIVRRALHKTSPELVVDSLDNSQQAAAQLSEDYSDREWKNTESDSCADIIPFSADEYEKITIQTDDEREYLKSKTNVSNQLRVSFSINEVHLTSTPRLPAGEVAAATMEPLDGDVILSSFEESKLQRSGKSESKDIGYSSEGYSNDELLDNSPRLWKAPSLGILQEWRKQTDNSEMVSSGFLSEDKSGILQSKQWPESVDAAREQTGSVVVGKESIWRHSITSAYDTSSNCGSEGEATQSKRNGPVENTYKNIISSPPKQFYKMTTIETDFSTDRNDTDDHVSDLGSSMSPRLNSDRDDRAQGSSCHIHKEPLTVNKIHESITKTLSLINSNSSASSVYANTHKNVENLILDGSLPSSPSGTSLTPHPRLKDNIRRRLKGDLVTDSSLKSETDSRVDSSCEASGESNSDVSDNDEFSTASDYSINVSSAVIGDSHITITPARTSASHLSLNCASKPSGITSPAANESIDVNSPYRKTRPNSRKDRPWSIVGFSRNDSDFEFKPMSTSETAINGDINSNVLPLIASTPNKISSDYMTEKYGIYSYKSASSGKIRKSKAQDVSPQSAASQNSSPYSKRKLSYKKRKHSSSGNPTNSASSISAQSRKHLSSSGTESGQTTLVKGLRHVRVQSSSSTWETDTSGDYLTPREESASDISSDEESPLNITTFSENAWDNYQDPLYPTVSEAPTEEPLHWEPPHDEFEFDDDINIAPRSSKLASSVIASKISNKLRHKEKKPSYVDEDSDSDLDELHHMIQQSRDYLDFTTTSLHKHRTDPLRTGISMKSTKYAEHVMTCETNLKCLAEVSDHVDNSISELCEREMHQIDDLIDEWSKLHELAQERHLQSRDLSAIYSDLTKVKVILDEAIPALSLGTFSNIMELDEAIVLLQEKCALIDSAWQQLSAADDNIDKFSSHNSGVPLNGFIDYTTDIHKLWNIAENMSSGHVALYKDSSFAWRTFVNATREISRGLETHRCLLKQLTNPADHHTDRKTEQKVLDDLSILKSIAVDLAMYEDKLHKLGKLQASLSPVLTDEARLRLDETRSNLMDERLTLHHWCQDTLTTLLDGSDLEKTLHDKFGKKKDRRGRHAHHFVCRLVKRATPVMFALVTLWLTSPESRDSLLFAFSPELSYVRGPPAT